MRLASGVGKLTGVTAEALTELSDCHRARRGRAIRQSWARGFLALPPYEDLQLSSTWDIPETFPHLAERLDLLGARDAASLVLLTHMGMVAIRIAAEKACIQPNSNVAFGGKRHHRAACGGADRGTTTAPRDPRPFIPVSQAAGRPWNLIPEQNVRSARALPEGQEYEQAERHHVRGGGSRRTGHQLRRRLVITSLATFLGSPTARPQGWIWICPPASPVAWN